MVAAIGSLYINDIFYFFTEILIAGAVVGALFMIIYLSESRLMGIFFNIFAPLQFFIIFISYLALTLTLNLIDTKFILFDFSYEVTVSGYIVRLLLLCFFLLFFKIIVMSFRQENMYIPEYLYLIGCSLCGLWLLVGASDFLLSYIALELYGLAICSASALFKISRVSLESTFKYFLLNCITSAIFLFCASAIYLIFGTINFYDLEILLPYYYLTEQNFLLDFMFILMIISLLAKIGLAPLQGWLINIYSNLPNQILIFILTMTKFTFFFFLTRLINLFFGASSLVWFLLVLLIGANLIIGSIGAIVQIRLRRFLIFSSIAGNSFFLAAILPGNFNFSPLFLFFSVSYILTLFGIFMIFISLFDYSNGKLLNKFGSLVGFYSYRPLLALGLLIFLASASGLPPLIGFMGKAIVFIVLVLQNVNYLYLVSVFILFSAFSIFYYMRINRLILVITPKNVIFFKPAPFILTFCVSSLCLTLLLLTFLFYYVFEMLDLIINYL